MGCQSINSEEQELFFSDVLNKLQLAKSGHCYKANLTWSCIVSLAFTPQKTSILIYLYGKI